MASPYTSTNVSTVSTSNVSTTSHQYPQQQQQPYMAREAVVSTPIAQNAQGFPVQPPPPTCFAESNSFASPTMDALPLQHGYTESFANLSSMSLHGLSAMSLKDVCDANQRPYWDIKSQSGNQETNDTYVFDPNSFVAPFFPSMTNVPASDGNHDLMTSQMMPPIQMRAPQAPPAQQQMNMCSNPNAYITKSAAVEMGSAPPVMAFAPGRARVDFKSMIGAPSTSATSSIAYHQQQPQPQPQQSPVQAVQQMPLEYNDSNATPSTISGVSTVQSGSQQVPAQSQSQSQSQTAQSRVPAAAGPAKAGDFVYSAKGDIIGVLELSMRPLPPNFKVGGSLSNPPISNGTDSYFASLSTDSKFRTTDSKPTLSNAPANKSGAAKGVRKGVTTGDDEKADEKRTITRATMKRGRHIAQSEKPFVCGVCGKGYKYRCNYRSHCKIHTDAAFVCEFCGKRFGRKSNWAEHVRVHTGEAPYQCKICNRSFKQHHGWKDHMRVHSGEKPYLCKLCDKRFAVGHNLNVHMRIHTGERPYVCEHCNSTFRQRSAYNSHLKNVHGGSASKRKKARKKEHWMKRKVVL